MQKQQMNSTLVVETTHRKTENCAPLATYFFFFDVHRKIIISTTIVLNDFCFCILNIQPPSIMSINKSTWCENK